MASWIYKCNARGDRHQVTWGDWAVFFDWDRTKEWGTTRNVPKLVDLAPGDTVLAYQTDRNELVGVAKVVRFRRDGRHLDLYLKPIERIGTKVRPLKKANPRVAAIEALRPGPIKTIYSITPAEARTLLRAARKAARS